MYSPLIARSQMWRHMPVIPARRKQTPESQDFGVILSISRKNHLGYETMSQKQMIPGWGVRIPV